MLIYRVSQKFVPLISCSITFVLHFDFLDDQLLSGYKWEFMWRIQ